MNRRQTTKIVLIVAAVGIAIAAIPRALDGNVTYHRLQFRAARGQIERIFSTAFIFSGQQWLLKAYSGAVINAVERMEYHRKRLVELGALTRCDFEFANIAPDSIESRHLWKTCYSHAASPFEDLTLWTGMPVHIAVWCHPSDRKAWQRFVTRYDVSNY